MISAFVFVVVFVVFVFVFVFVVVVVVVLLCLLRLLLMVDKTVQSVALYDVLETSWFPQHLRINGKHKNLTYFPCSMFWRHSWFLEHSISEQHNHVAQQYLQCSAGIHGSSSTTKP